MGKKIQGADNTFRPPALVQFQIAGDMLQNGQAQIICSNGGPTGTSYAAPLWAGFLADTNQQAIADSLPVVGWINPTLYLLGVRSNYLAAFHDITSGSSTNNYGTFNATTGYDLTTGWGSPNGQGFMAAMLYASNINQFWFGAPYNANTGEYSLPGFGSFQLYPNGWINHDQLGWIWVSLPATLTDAWFWVSKMNTWVWFDLVNFPAIWSESDNSWLLYSEWTTNPSYFWNYNTQKWETY